MYQMQRNVSGWYIKYKCEWPMDILNIKGFKIILYFIFTKDVESFLLSVLNKTVHP